ncbi:phosphopantetheine-binding protein [Rhizomonospora bruguierae]|uniref:phosphopantetheine-binding protein n=1 Tax=Rhizomonospora bruguierae TaxID=1581705 RepID=UPI001BD1B59C|nr:phosphopantetheine-binding protein [Micromonospora sp. NBRC 107566]
MSEPATPDGADATAAAVLRMWTELGLRPGSAADDFFAAGGQSLTLVRFLAQVQEAYGVELPVDRLFDEDLTAAVAARLITEAQLDAADEGDLAAILAEVEGLSETELAALLAEAE